MACLGRTFAGWSVSCALPWLAIVWQATASVPALAFVPTVTSTGSGVTWRGDFKLNLAGNSVNACGLSEQDFRSAVVRSLQRWQAASEGRIRFDYWQGTDPSIYLPGSVYDGLSSLYFASNAPTDPHLSPNVLGLTQVWYDTSNGKILESDIVLNDRSFEFTTRPQDTSGFGSGGAGAPPGTRSRVFVENVLTHELGHAFGLSHSGGLQSTMLFIESPEQAHLGCDEQVGMRALYPPDGTPSAGLSGSVLTREGAPVFGAHVVAISRRRGVALATGLTDAAGRYEISGLEPGGYFLMAEPFFAGSGALPAYYSAMTCAVCRGGSEFSRTFLADAAARPIEVVSASGAVAAAPPIQVGCGAERSADLPELAGGSVSGQKGGFGVLGKVPRSGRTRVGVTGLTGHLEVHALSYTLFSPISLGLSLRDSSGRLVSQSKPGEGIYFGDSGYVNYDSALVVDGLPSGDYQLELEAAPLDPARFPGGFMELDASGFVLLTGSINEADPALAATIPVNPRCRMNEAFAPYASPPGNPPRTAVDGASGSGHIGFCGSTQKRNGPSMSDSAHLGEIIGWILPWAFMLLVLKLRIAKFLWLAPSSRTGYFKCHATSTAASPVFLELRDLGSLWGSGFGWRGVSSRTSAR